MIRLSLQGAGLVVLVVLAACSDTAPESAEPDERIAATFDGGEVTLEEVDGYVLSLPANKRRLPGRDLIEWYEEVAGRLALEKLLREEASRLGLESEPDLVSSLAIARRTMAVEICLSQKHSFEIRGPTEDELREEYDRNQARWVREESRQVYNLFLRRSDDRTPAGVLRELEEIRDRAMGGENFSLLAREFSESETRHQGGQMGTVRRGDLTPDLEKVIFALQEGVPSEPILTKEGGHLFLVEKADERLVASYEQMRDRLQERILGARREEAVADWEDTLELPVGSFVPTQGQLLNLVRAGDPESVVLKVGEQVVKLADFNAQLEHVRSQQGERVQGGARAKTDLPWWVLQQMQRRELIYNQCRQDGDIPQEALEDSIAQWLEEALPTLLTQRRLEERLDGAEDRLESFYESNPGRFSTAPRWNLRSLTVEPRGDADKLMRRLETSVNLLGAGMLTLEDLASQVGGEVEDLGWRTSSELRRLSPRTPSFVSQLRTGTYSPPFGVGKSWMILQAVDREEPEIQPYDTVRDRVRQEYLVLHNESLRAEFSAEVLAEADFKAYPLHLEALRGSKRGRRPGQMQEVVKELVDLLEELEE